MQLYTIELKLAYAPLIISTIFNALLTSNLTLEEQLPSLYYFYSTILIILKAPHLLLMAFPSFPAYLLPPLNYHNVAYVIAKWAINE